MFAYACSGSCAEAACHEGREILALLSFPSLRNELCWFVEIFLIKIISD